jgi:DNA (cytosine-5)-methyltransferase 1
MLRTNNDLTAIDLFSGCGGISSGLTQAGLRMVAGIDVWSEALDTYKENFKKAKAINLDVSETSPRTLMRELGLRKGQLFMLAGGPPCQGFSKNVPRRQRYLEDPKNLLVCSFLDYAEALLPEVVLMENVAEFKNGFDSTFTTEVEERLGENYHVYHAVLAAHEYGVPQRRRRAFFIATHKRLNTPFPIPSHGKSTGKLSLLPQQSLRPFVTVWDAIGDLPSLRHGEGFEGARLAREPFTEYQGMMRAKRVQVSNHVARRLRPTQYERLASIAPGQGIKDLPDNLRPKSGYSGAYGRLTKDMVAPTITRWVFHPGSGRYGHPVDIRVITMREAARLQGFSDDFVFKGSYIEQAHQIGNAVPPLLIKQIVENLRHALGV